MKVNRPRYNVSDVAEVLISKIGEFKTSAEEIKEIVEDLKNLTVPIDSDSMDELRELIREQNKRENEADRQRKQFLDVLSKFNEKQTTRLPNWVLGLIIVSFVTIIGSFFFIWIQLKG